MSVTHEPWIVALSLLVAIQGAYVAIGLSLQISAAHGMKRRLLLAGAAFTFAVAVWSMHFVGNLAVRTPFPLDYLVLPTLLSFLVCVFVVGVAIFVASLYPAFKPALAISAVVMGTGIATMHYMGMMALHGSTVMHHDPAHVVASFLIGVAASALGLWFAFSRTRKVPLLAAAIALGLAISGMHYAAMAGLTLDPAMEPMGHDATALSPDILAVVVAVVAFAVSAVFLLTLVPDTGPITSVESGTEPGFAQDFTVQNTLILPEIDGAAPVSRSPLGGAGGPKPRAAKVLPVEKDGAIHYLPTESIVAVQANAHYTTVYDGKGHYFCSLSIGDVEARLDGRRFLRVHRSHIVAIDRISALKRTGDGGQAQFDLPEVPAVPVSRSRFSALKTQIETLTT
jgi:NO-binding membrane sensor protein with MHYT domain